MKNRNARSPLKPSVLAVVGALAAMAAMVTPSQAQTSQQTEPAPAPSGAAPAAPAADSVVVVTGFRASLNSALNTKRSSDGIIDVIKAEDIAKFPDANLAESLQRVPGVSLTRGDGGEGKQITVRGLNAGFTRVRINGIEGVTATGASDINGSTNRGRGFDFSVFASELFNSLEVRKTSEASVEEGSLGATVDLRTARPFDFKGRTFSLGAQEMHNSLSEKYSPRVTALLSDRWKTPYGQFGALISAAYSKRTVQEEATRRSSCSAPATTAAFARRPATRRKTRPTTPSRASTRPTAASACRARPTRPPTPTSCRAPTTTAAPSPTRCPARARSRRAFRATAAR